MNNLSRSCPPFLPCEIWSHIVQKGNISIQDAQHLRLVCKDIQILPSCVPVPISFSIDRMSANGFLEAIKWVMSDKNAKFFMSIRSMDWAAINGRLDMVKWFCEENMKRFGYRFECIESAMNMASKGGHLSIMEWIVEKAKIDDLNTLVSNSNSRSNKYTPIKALDNAATNGDKAIFEWIVSEYGIKSPLPVSCFYKALSNGHLELSRWLYDHIDKSILNANVNAVDHIYFNSFAYFKDLVVIRRQKDVYEWLCEQNLADFHSWGLTAAQYGHLDLLKDICLKKKDIDVVWLMDSAIRSGQFEVVSWINEEYEVDIDYARMIACNGYTMTTDFIIWMIEKFIECIEKERRDRDKKKESKDTRDPSPETELLTQDSIDSIICHLIAASGNVGVMSWYKAIRENKAPSYNDNIEDIPSTDSTEDYDEYSSAFTPSSSYSPLEERHIPEKGGSEENDANIFSIPPLTLSIALSFGHIDFVRFLLESCQVDEQSVNFEAFIIIDFIIDEYCDIDTLEYWVMICMRNKKRALYTCAAIDNAAKYGRQDIIEWILENKDRLHFILTQVLVIEIQVVEGENWGEHENEEGMPLEDVQVGLPLEDVQVGLPLEDVQVGLPQVGQPLEQRLQPYSRNAMDDAAENGHLHILKYFHERLGKENCVCSHRAMDKAAGNGHHDCVQWLHQNRDEGCSSRAIERALQNGRIDMIQWLNKYRHDACYRESALNRISQTTQCDEDIEMMKEWIINNCKKID